MNLRLRTIRDTFLDWTGGQCRAYYAGISAADEDQIATLAVLFSNEREFFYRGCADALGEDATGEDWFTHVAGWQIRNRWWESQEDIE